MGGQITFNAVPQMGVARTETLVGTPPFCAILSGGTGHRGAFLGHYNPVISWLANNGTSQ